MKRVSLPDLSRVRLRVPTLGTLREAFFTVGGLGLAVAGFADTLGRPGALFAGAAALIIMEFLTRPEKGAR